MYLQRLELGRIMEDLDRCRHGRHQGDPCRNCPEGTSAGNPHIVAGATIGYNIDGGPYHAPEDLRAVFDPYAWAPHLDPLDVQPGPGPAPYRASPNVVRLLNAVVTQPEGQAYNRPDPMMWLGYVRMIADLIWSEAYNAGQVASQETLAHSTLVLTDKERAEFSRNLAELGITPPETGE